MVVEVGLYTNTRLKKSSLNLASRAIAAEPNEFVTSKKKEKGGKGKVSGEPISCLYSKLASLCLHIQSGKSTPPPQSL